MIRNYLTYSFAQNFQRGCSILNLAPTVKERLLRSAEQMVEHFAISVQSEDRGKELRLLGMSFAKLQECKETLDQAKAWTYDLKGVFIVLDGRMRQLCRDATVPGEPHATAEFSESWRGGARRIRS